LLLLFANGTTCFNTDYVSTDTEITLAIFTDKRYPTKTDQL